MHPLNVVLDRFGLQLGRTRAKNIPRAFMAEYRSNYRALKGNVRGFNLFRELYYEAGSHPESYVDFECSFASRHITRVQPETVLDIGSYRAFVFGLLAGFRLTTVDVRARKVIHPNETSVASDASDLKIPDRSFDVVTSLCALEHFGLGRYGDTFDPDGDIKAVREMARVLKPGARLILTTSITRAQPSIAYNAHRIYSYEMLKSMFGGLELEEEQFYSNRLRRSCPMADVTDRPGVWDNYAGCWRKPAS
jgi:SAM-dependent methyltransferase